MSSHQFDKLLSTLLHPSKCDNKCRSSHCSSKRPSDNILHQASIHQHIVHPTYPSSGNAFSFQSDSYMYQRIHLKAPSSPYAQKEEIPFFGIGTDSIIGLNISRLFSPAFASYFQYLVSLLLWSTGLFSGSFPFHKALYKMCVSNCASFSRSVTKSCA